MFDITILLLSMLPALLIVRYMLKEDNTSWTRGELLIITYMACFEDLRSGSTTRELKRISKKLNRSFHSVEEKLHDIRTYFLQYNPEVNAEFEIAVDIIMASSTQEEAKKIKEELLQSYK